jgi:hypothetical protein
MAIWVGSLGEAVGKLANLVLWRMLAYHVLSLTFCIYSKIGQLARRFLTIGTLGSWINRLLHVNSLAGTPEF